MLQRDLGFSCWEAAAAAQNSSTSRVVCGSGRWQALALLSSCLQAGVVHLQVLSGLLWCSWHIHLLQAGIGCGSWCRGVSMEARAMQAAAAAAVPQQQPSQGVGQAKGCWPLQGQRRSKLAGSLQLHSRRAAAPVHLLLLHTTLAPAAAVAGQRAGGPQGMHGCSGCWWVQPLLQPWGLGWRRTAGGGRGLLLRRCRGQQQSQRARHRQGSGAGGCCRSWRNNLWRYGQRPLHLEL